MNEYTPNKKPAVWKAGTLQRARQDFADQDREKLVGWAAWGLNADLPLA